MALVFEPGTSGSAVKCLLINIVNTAHSRLKLAMSRLFTIRFIKFSILNLTKSTRWLQLTSPYVSISFFFSMGVFLHQMLRSSPLIHNNFLLAHSGHLILTLTFFLLLFFVFFIFSITLLFFLVMFFTTAWHSLHIAPSQLGVHAAFLLLCTEQ